MAFDTLSYARRLKAAGMPEAQAEAVAEATRDAITADAATKADIARLETSIERLQASTKTEFADVRHEIATLRADLTHEIENVRHGMATLRTDLTHEIGNVRRDMAALGAELKNDMAALGLRLTVRLGGLIAVGVAALAAINKL